MKTYSKNALLIALVISLGVITVAFAALSTNLNIKASAKVANSKWDIHFENLTLVENTVNNTGTVITPARIANNTQITGLVADLKKPGDSVSYTFDIVNDGDIGAKITTILITPPSCGTNTDACQKLQYSVKYTTSGVAPAIGNTLNKKSRVNATLTLKYKDNDPLSTPNDVSASGLEIEILYGQN